MLDIKTIRENPDAVKAALKNKKVDPTVIDEILSLDAERRDLTTETEALRARKNALSKEIPQAAKSGGDIGPLKEESKEIGETLKAKDERLKVIQDEQKALIMKTPNTPHASAPVGFTDADNKEVRVWGERPEYDFTPKSHWELGKELDILDLERGVKISGSGFYALKGAGAKLERVLINWMLNHHTSHNGYEEIQAPHIVSRETMTGTGQLPKMEEDMYRLEADDLFLIPTAEVPITNLHANEILDPGQVPLKYVVYTPCFRREAGSYGKENRGISRVHQFDKVEMVQYQKPEVSYEALESLTRNATELLEALGLHYRVLDLCTGDLSFAAAKCYDIEVWAPGMNMWLEVSSCSNFEDFQARRANIRFRREPEAKPEFVHTLNGSGLALPRLWIAIVETYQQADGSIKLPAALHALFGGDTIKAKG